ncbi:MAG: helix-turn-helix domain-containing protein [Paracoccaceae bacterium]|nr:helix-turn-helix domain-containing protein [Paracoccaceae bacterium]
MSEPALNWYTNEAATFGDRVAAAREARQLSPKALARHLGVATKTVDGWENDISEPRANKLQMLSGVLNVSIPWLLTGEGQSFEPDPSDTADVLAVLTEVRTLRAEMQTAAERLGVLEKRIRQLINE